MHQTIRVLTNTEIAEIESSWIGRIRCNQLFSGGGMILFLVLAHYTERPMVPLIIAAAFAIYLLCSLRDLGLINQDRSAGITEEILGFAQKKEKGNLLRILGMLGPVAGIIAAPLDYLISRISIDGMSISFTLFTGHPFVLINYDSKEILCMSGDAAHDIGDGSLVKVSVLPISRSALKVKRTRLDTL